jgi:hypothetical protein
MVSWRHPGTFMEELKNVAINPSKDCIRLSLNSNIVPLE